MKRARKTAAAVLKLERHDETREREFELDYLTSLTVEERFRMMHEASRRMLETLVSRGHRKPFEIVKRA